MMSSEEIFSVSSISDGSHPQVPSIRVNPPNETTLTSRRRRKQERPQRSLKQLASVAEKIIHGIIVIEPLLPWEKHTMERRHQYQYQHQEKKVNKSLKKSKRIRVSEESASEEGSIGFSPAFTPGARPTVTRSPASMGFHIPQDQDEEGLSHRGKLYEEVLTKRRTGPSRSGMPLDISAAPGSSLLDDSEFEVCSTLRLYPLQYFQARDTLVGNYHKLGFFKKSAAQKMLHIDVNKTGKLYDYFVSRNWMPYSTNQGDLEKVIKAPLVDWSGIDQ